MPKPFTAGKSFGRAILGAMYGADHPLSTCTETVGARSKRLNFIESQLSGAFIIEPQRLADERGFFARSWCHKEGAAHGLSPNWVQCSISFNKKKGTLRGMHYQAPPCAEAKLVRCTMGAIYDVIIDLRPESATYKQWTAVDLTAENRRMLYIPEGFAHGFLTLNDDTEIFYQMSEFYAPSHARGLRWDDPAFAIEWPLAPRVMSAQDRALPLFGSQKV
jgi:dTDP-4-dehydrorhamnose 3,5-epimerase